MSEKDVQQLADAIIQKMKEEHHVFWVDPQTHAEQHGFLAMLIAEREEKAARRKRIEEKIAGSMILSALLILVGIIGSGAMAWLRKNL